mmetsp:Transcript_3954/g.6762  ORF Transcript_3954/g.6762 Transcript_3954/m.6762 type:complete len:591 (-) Transcript_3954:625-2397(-)
MNRWVWCCSLVSCGSLSPRIAHDPGPALPPSVIMVGMCTPRIFWTTFLLIVSTCTTCCAEIRKFTGLIEAASTYVHYSEGYLVAPGFVDLKYLEFKAGERGAGGGSVQAGKGGAHIGDDDAESGVHDESQPKGSGGNRMLSDVGAVKSELDIAFFYLPKNCSNNKNGCDWTDLGVGAKNENGIRWCCSNDAIEFGFCDGGTHYGRLIINKSLFTGQERSLLIPATGDMNSHLKYSQMQDRNHTGKFVLLFANCNEEGRDVLVEGSYEWKSRHGYLPGEIFSEMYFFMLLTFLYLVLLLWYGFSMRLYEDATIPIQKWILGAIIMGLLETFFRSGDYLVWNEDGTRFWFAMYTGKLLGTFKQALSACLIVMVSLGWGVVRDNLGSNLLWILILGTCYVLADTAYEFFPIFFNPAENQTMDQDATKKFIKFETIIKFVVDVICVLFYLWILDSLNCTMQYLENMNQSMKLLRYLRLRCLLLFSILFGFVWFVFGAVNEMMEESILEEQQEWTVKALNELNYLALLVGVAILWRPDPNAKEFAYVMELPAIGGDENELEMTANVPSALDDDEDVEETENGGYKDNKNVDVELS